MNQSSYDEYEDVESPFAPKSSGKNTAQKDRLRSRKNVFNRPFATTSSAAPIIVETKSSRRSIGHTDMEDMLENHESGLSETDIDYLNEEDDEVPQKLPQVRATNKKNTKTKKNLLPKIAWAVIGMLVLRLICMDRGVWDYFVTEGEVREKQNELKSIRDENSSLKNEISRIQLDRNYQRQLAKEHLGVIAVDEFLILFAGESSDSTTENPAQI